MTVVGRYFAMDRDRRWDRTKKAWDAWCLVEAKFATATPADALRQKYAEGKTDEFMPPLIFALR